MLTDNYYIGVIDGQGGGIGTHIIKSLRELSDDLEIVALGTNAVATAAMMKAKANRGASGENAIVQTVPTLHLILGPLAVAVPNSMMGEITPKMAEVISSARATKILLPLKISNMELAGFKSDPLPHLVSAMMERVKSLLPTGEK